MGQGALLRFKHSDMWIYVIFPNIRMISTCTEKKGNKLPDQTEEGKVSKWKSTAVNKVSADSKVFTGVKISRCHDVLK